MSEAKNKDVARVWIRLGDGRYEKGFCLYNDLFTSDLATNRGQKTHIDTYPTEDCLPNQRRSLASDEVFRANELSLDHANDMTSLTYLEEPNMLECLETRYDEDNIYTSIAGVLVAINPYHNLGIYTQDWMAKYRGQKRLDVLPPHVFAVAEKAYQELTKKKVNQSMICCGESGSGKTESTKMLMRYLANVTTIHADFTDTRVYSRSVIEPPPPAHQPPMKINDQAPDASPVEKQVLQSNPVLEAFGNARTLMNDNSSRFAKFMKLFFKEGRIIGAHTETYLLEKSRVVSVNAGERNFHIFYQICASPVMAKEFDLGDDAAKSFHYLNQGKTLTLKQVTDLSRFHETAEGMKEMNFSADEQLNAFRIVAGVMSLGNISFISEEQEAKNAASKSIIPDSSLPWIKKAASLLNVDEKELTARLTTHRIKIRRENIQKKLGVKDAITNRDAIAKTAYNALFKWIVKRINDTLYSGQDDTQDDAINWIGVLDVFGFECFEKNSFEQFCINFANEKLQSFFNTHIIKSEQAEYKREAIYWVPVDIPDNSDVISLIASKPSGILCLLDSACIMPKGSQETFHNNLFAVHGRHRRLLRGTAKDKEKEEQKAQARMSIMGAKPTTRPGRRNKKKGKQDAYYGFYVKHYAADVLYDAQAFLFKNSDSTHMDTVKMFASSSSSLVHDLFVDEAKALDDEEGARSFRSVGTTFSKQLSSLMETLMATTPYFIRCASPNSVQQAHNYQWKYVQPQLRCGGLVEALRVLKFGFPSRVTYESITERYADALQPRPANLNARNFCEAILVAFGLGRSQYQLGLTKVFFRPGKQEFLESIFRRSDEPLTPEIEAAIRKWLVVRRNQRAAQSVRIFVHFRKRLKYIRAVNAARKTVRLAVIYTQTLQASLKRVRRMRGARNNAVPLIQRWFRHYTVRRKLRDNLEKRVKQKRKNRFKFGGLDAKSAEELNVLRVQMKSAKRKQEEEKKKLAKLQAEMEAKERAARDELERKKAEHEAMMEQLEEMKRKEMDNAKRDEMVEKLRLETERMKEEQKQAAQQARLIVQQREAEYKRREDELRRMREEAEARRLEAEKKAAEIAEQKEEERKQRMADLARLEAQTVSLRTESERKAQEAERLLKEREELARQKEAELQRLAEEAKKAQDATEELQMERDAERRKKLEEQKRLEAEIEEMRARVEAEKEQATDLLRQREEENERKQQELETLQRDQENLKKVHEEQRAQLEMEKEKERREREEALKLMEQENIRTKELYEEQARQQQQVLEEKEAENKRKEEYLRKMNEEARRLREEQEQKQREAEALLKKQEEEAQAQLQRLQEEQEAARKEFERQQREAEEQAQKQLEESLKASEQKSQSELEQTKASHAAEVKQLRLVILEREDEIERIMEESAQAAEEADQRYTDLSAVLAMQKATTAAREMDIQDLNEKMDQMQKAHEEVSAISQRLLDEAQQEIARLKEQYKQDTGKLKSELSALTTEHKTLQQDHEDLKSHFQKELEKQVENEGTKSKGLDRAKTFQYRPASDSPATLEVDFDMPMTRGRKATDARPDFTSILEASILEQKGKADFLAQFKRREGWAQKRRPGNKLLGKKYKTRFLLLEDATLSWHSEEANAGKELGRLYLGDFMPIEYDESQLDADGELPPDFEIKLLPKFKSVRDALVLQAAPGKVDKNNPHARTPPSISMIEWVKDINKRIAVATYLDEMFKATNKKGCRELVQFVCDDKHSNELRIENKVVDLHSALLALQDPLQNRAHLRKIVLNNIALADPSMHVLGQIIAQNNDILELEIMHNLISDTGAGYLAEALEQNTSVRVIKLNHNNIGNKGLAAIARVLPKHAILQRLALTGNKIGNMGAQALSEALVTLGKAYRFPKIELASNLVGNEGLQALSKAVVANPNIKSLDLSRNVVSDAGVLELANALESKTCGIVELNLASNQISSNGVVFLSKAMKATKGALSVDLSNNKLITRTGVVSIVNADFALEFAALKVVRGRGSQSIFVKRMTVEEQFGK